MGSSYTDLQVVADVDARPGFVTFGVLYDDVFVPIAQQSRGLVAQMKRAAADREAPQVSSASDEQVAELQKRLDDANAELQAVTRQLAAMQSGSTSGAPASTGSAAVSAGAPDAGGTGTGAQQGPNEPPPPPQGTQGASV